MNLILLKEISKKNKKDLNNYKINRMKFKKNGAKNNCNLKNV